MPDADLTPDADPGSRIELYWLPLGAGGRSVRVNGLLYEAVAARVGRRPVADLHHSALVVHDRESGT
jgi:hypothetical protein